jgi:ubiquinone/menaquinone biosynthesis C-methylase UbiE
MLSKLYTRLCKLYPRFRKFTRQRMYQFLAKQYQQQDWTFMNYGYASLESEEAAAPLHLEDDDEINRYCIQLYDHVTDSVDLSGLRVLEVGSGRGGGADYVQRYLHPKTMIGVDFSGRAVTLCNRLYRQAGLTFVPGDAERLPFKDQSFDAVINVESSHCYGSMDAFLAQVRRVLRPGGYFLFADFRSEEQLPALDEQLHRTHMRVLRHRDISRNVLSALDADHGRRVAHIRRGAPKLLAKLVGEFAGVKGSTIYERLRDGEVIYQSFVLQKRPA